MSKLRRVIPLVLLILCPLAMSAEPKSQTIFSNVGSSTSDRPMNPVGANSIEIQATSDSSKVTLKTGNTISKAKADGRGVFSSWGFGVSSPLNKDEDKTDLATLDGLVNSTTASANYTRYITPQRNAITFAGGDEAFEKIYDSVCADVEKGHSDSGSNQPLPSCFEKNAILEFAENRWDEVEHLFFDPEGSYHIISFDASVGYRKYKYVDPLSLENDEETENPWSVKASYGFLPRKLNTLFVVGLEYQEGYKNSDQGTLCPLADPMTGIATCASGPIGSPVDDNKELLSFEARRMIGKAGVSLKVTYDNEDDVVGIDIPIQFIENKSSGLTGGIRFGWRDDTDDVVVGVFVGSSFNLFN